MITAAIKYKRVLVLITLINIFCVLFACRGGRREREVEGRRDKDGQKRKAFSDLLPFGFRSVPSKSVIERVGDTMRRGVEAGWWLITGECLG